MREIRLQSRGLLLEVLAILGFQNSLLAAPNIQRDTQGHPEEGCLRSRHLQFRIAHSTDEHRSNPVFLCPNLQNEHVGQKQLLPASLGKALFFLNFMKILQVSFFKNK